jgi:hypothetical protein
MDKEYLQEVARAIEAKMPDNHGFVLLVAPFGEGKRRGVYASNMKREDAVNVIKEWLIRAGHEEDWMKQLP